MPAVTAIAMAPQTTTRTVARTRGAPPSRAPRSPSSPEREERHDHGHATRAPRRRHATASSGSAAPVENDSAEAHAA